MVDLTPLWGFVIVSAVVIISPGADTMLLIRSSMEGGRRSGYATFAGIHTGNLILTTLVSSGLGVLMARNHPVMLAVQLLGGCYLLWLAIGSARAVVRRRRAGDGPVGHDAGSSTSDSARARFTQGLVSNLTNAKLLVFYLSFLPQFLGHASSSFAQLEMLAILFIVVAMAWHSVLILASARMQHLLERPAFSTTLEVLSTLVFAGLGLGILVEALG